MLLSAGLYISTRPPTPVASHPRTLSAAASLHLSPTSSPELPLMAWLLPPLTAPKCLLFGDCCPQKIPPPYPCTFVLQRLRLELGA